MDFVAIFEKGGYPLLLVTGAVVIIRYLYQDMKQERKQMREDHKLQLDEAKKRESKLLQHLDKVATTLDNINDRLCEVENCIKRSGVS